MSIIGVHPHNANELLKWLQKSGFSDIMLGDFNAGDYKKDARIVSLKIIEIIIGN